MDKEEIEDVFYSELRSALLMDRIPKGEFVIKVTNGNEYEVELIEINSENYETDSF